MFGYTKKIIAAVSLLALYPVQHEAHCSDVDFDAGFKNVKGLAIHHKSFEESKEPKIVTMGANGRDIKTRLLIEASKKTRPSILRLVCKDFRDIIDTGTPDNIGLRYSTIGSVWKQCIHAWYGVLGHEGTWQTILNGELVYKPNPDSDDGIKRLKISDLPNPFAGSFDLSDCGDAGKYVSISMGLRKGKKDSNKDKSEIWLIPRFLAMQKLEGNASYLKETMGQWSGETLVAVIFNWWSNPNDAYAYCYWADYATLRKTNLGVIYMDEKTSPCVGAWGGACGPSVANAISCFVFKLA